MTEVDWRSYIGGEPGVLAGKPVVKGTRLSAEFLLDLLANGWSAGQIYENYPHLPPGGLEAVLAFAAESMRELEFFAIPPAPH